MIDVETRQRLLVHDEGTAGPYLLVPMDQLEEVRRVLLSKHIRHSLSPDAIQLDGRPVIAIVDFGSKADVQSIQAALDAA